MPAMAWSRLVLPLPFGPIRQVSVPASRVSDVSSRRPGIYKAVATRRLTG
jgi:hypothetical protein